MKDIGKSAAYAMINIMNENNLNCNKLELKSEIPRETIWSIVNGKVKNPSLKTIYKFCKAIGMTLEKFFARSEFAEKECDDSNANSNENE